MVDVHRPDQRSANMRAIRHKDTVPEIEIRSLLFKKGFRFRLHVKSLPGSPDIVLPKHRVVVFVHGCFWHGHGCHLFKVPATRTEFWMKKIEDNRERDYRDEMKLLASGWRVAVVWECALKGKLKRSTFELVQHLTDWILAADMDVPKLDVHHL
jgi:DNA mismatch endonuclease (patch repair protein)